MAHLHAIGARAALFLGLSLALASVAGASEAELILPDVGAVTFLGMSGRALLLVGIAICCLGGLFGLATALALRKLPVHRSMREISELIYETCKTYLITQGKFILLLELCIGIIMTVYF